MNKHTRDDRYYPKRKPPDEPYGDDKKKWYDTDSDLPSKEAGKANGFLMIQMSKATMKIRPTIVLQSDKQMRNKLRAIINAISIFFVVSSFVDFQNRLHHLSLSLVKPFHNLKNERLRPPKLF